jgi:hypothetical protein
MVLRLRQIKVSGEHLFQVHVMNLTSEDVLFRAIVQDGKMTNNGNIVETAGSNTLCSLVELRQGI